MHACRVAVCGGRSLAIAILSVPYIGEWGDAVVVAEKGYFRVFVAFFIYFLHKYNCTCGAKRRHARLQKER